jgi:serine/threonine-protein kinase
VSSETIIPPAEPARPSDSLGVTVIDSPVPDSRAGTSGNARPRARADATFGFGETVLPLVDRTTRVISVPDRGDVRFRTLSKLGEGGLGEVVAAFDEDIGRKVAVKRIRADRVTPGALARFVQEIRTVGALEHANIVPIHDVGRDAEGALYFVMRYVDGETLESVITKLRAGDPAYHARYGFERRVRIVAQVLEALAFAHSHGIIHRDVKPANVMIGRYGEVMLLDWGIARLVGSPDLHGDDAGPAPIAETRVGGIIGTPAYMSPEQARGEPADARSDVFSVSVLLHEFLTLQHYLHDCETVEQMLEAVRTRSVPAASFVPSPHQPRVPMDLGWLVHDGTHRDPAKRYPSAQAMLDRVARRAEGDIPIQCHVTFTKQMNNKMMKFFDRNVFLVTGVVGIGVVAAIGEAVASMMR